MDAPDLKDTAHQKDLFSEIIQDAGEGRAQVRQVPPKNKKSMSVNLDKILLFLLTCAIIFAIVFSYGIETGKRLTKGAKEDRGQGLEFSLDPINVKSSTLQTETAQESDDSSTTEETIPLTADSKLEQALTKPVTSGAETANTGEVSLPPYFWTVQIITYINSAYANQEVRKFQDQGYEGFVIPSGKYLQVCIGRYPTREEALKVLGKFKKQKDYSDAYLRKVKRESI